MSEVLTAVHELTPVRLAAILRRNNFLLADGGDVAVEEIIRCLFFLMVAWSPAQLARGAWAERMHAALAAYERCHCAEVW